VGVENHLIVLVGHELELNGSGVDAGAESCFVLVSEHYIALHVEDGVVNLVAVGGFSESTGLHIVETDVEGNFAVIGSGAERLFA